MHEAIAELYRMVTGQEFEPWQLATLADMLACGYDGQWTAREFRIHTGQGAQLLEARALAGLFVLDEDLIWARRGREALRGQFRRLRALIEGSDWLRQQVRRVGAANGEERIELRTGRRLLFMHGGNGLRGLSVDCVLLDGYLNDIDTNRTNAWPCMRSRPNPQMVIA